jgi:hypothetical protein
MDFIVELPRSDDYTQVWVVVDRFTKMAHFIPLPTQASAKDLAVSFLREIWKLHGLPEEIISDRDTKFTSKFWSSLMTLLSITQRLSTAFHPETDGQTERVNQSLEQYLRMFCNYSQDNWVELLPLAEFAYNNSVTSAIGMSPFYANYGYNPQTTWLKQREAKNPAASTYSHWLQEVHERCLTQLKDTQSSMGTYADKRRTTPPPFAVGDKVLVNSKYMKTKRPSKKLNHRYLGPFHIKKLVGSRAVKVALPKTIRCHDVFHISLLEPYTSNTLKGREVTLPEPEIVDGEEEYEPERILAAEWRKAKRGNKKWVEYLVQWKGYPVGDSTFETTDAFNESSRPLLRAFYDENPKAPRDESLTL